MVNNELGVCQQKYMNILLTNFEIIDLVVLLLINIIIMMGGTEFPLVWPLFEGYYLLLFISGYLANQ